MTNGLTADHREAAGWMEAVESAATQIPNGNLLEFTPITHLDGSALSARQRRIADTYGIEWCQEPHHPRRKNVREPLTGAVGAVVGVTAGLIAASTVGANTSTLLGTIGWYLVAIVGLTGAFVGIAAMMPEEEFFAIVSIPALWAYSVALLVSAFFGITWFWIVLLVLAAGITAILTLDLDGASWLTVGALWSAIAALAAVVEGYGLFGYFAALVVILAPAAAAIWYYVATDPLGWSTDDVQQVSAAFSFVGDELQRVPYSTQTRFAFLTRDLVSQVRTNPAWNSPDLDIHRLRIDLDEELRQITQSLERVAVSRMRTPTPKNDLLNPGPAQRAQSAWAAHELLLDEAELAARRRIAALYGYLQGLCALEPLLHNMKVVRSLMSEHDDIGVLLTQIERDGMASAQMGEFRAELRDIEQAMLARLTYLDNAVIHSPTLQQPLLTVTRR